MSLAHRHSHVHLLVHVVFKVKHRQPTIATAEQEFFLRGVITAHCHSMDVWVCGAGAASDHLHLLLRLNPTVAISDLVGQLKGKSAWLWNREHVDWPMLKWQDGYWAETVSPRELERVAAYVDRQREHHGQNRLAEEFEPGP